MLKINETKFLNIKCIFFLIRVYLHLVKCLDFFGRVNRLVTPGRFWRGAGQRAAGYGVRGEKWYVERCRCNRPTRIYVGHARVVVAQSPAKRSGRMKSPRKHIYGGRPFKRPFFPRFAPQRFPSHCGIILPTDVWEQAWEHSGRSRAKMGENDLKRWNNDK